MFSKIVLLDVDGVLADFLGTVLRLSGVKKTPADICDWDLKKSLTDDEHDAVVDVLSNSRSVAREMDVIPGAVEAVKAIGDAGFEVVIVTSPWLSNHSWESQRRTWLWHNFGIRSKSVISTSAKRLVRGAVLVDDKPDTIDEWTAAHGRPGVLFRHPFNFAAPAPASIVGWSPSAVAEVLAIAGAE